MSSADSTPTTGTSRRAPTPERSRIVLRALPPRYDIMGAVAHLADELLNPPSGSVDPVAALDHLRRRLHATDALVWSCDDGRASRALHVGTSAVADAPSVIDLGEGAAALQRLRFSGTVLSRHGDVSGLEPLAPPGARSFAAAAASQRDAVTAVLTIAWKGAATPHDEPLTGLRVAAGLLARALGADGTPKQDNPSGAVLESLGVRVAALDRNGVIIAVSAGWTDFARQHGLMTPDAVGRGVNYLEVTRRAAANGCTEAAIALKGIESVCTGASNTFESAYAWDALGEERWSLMTVTPLRRRAGGAVIVHNDLTHPLTLELARRMSGKQFQALADALPVPVWIATPDGRMLYSNERWMPGVDGAAARAQHAVWTDALHPADRDRAKAAFEENVARREGFGMEVRLKEADGAYHWVVCSAAPRFDSEGAVESYAAVCWDASAKRRAEAAFTQAAGKLVAAQETERGRIARELHDDLGQQIAVLGSRLDSLTSAITSGRQISRRSQQLRTEFRQARETLQEIAIRVHTLSHQLHPAKLRLLGLVQTLKSLCRDEAHGSTVRVRFRASGIPRDVDEDIALCLFRVAQEALRNALKHSAGTAISVVLSVAGSDLKLEVTDNGIGFNPLTSQITGLGLLTMRERVELVGGTFAVQSAQPQGTTIRATVPLKVSGTAALPIAPLRPARVRPRSTRPASSDQDSESRE
jgi:PAS domain S-box-containing protein